MASFNADLWQNGSLPYQISQNLTWSAGSLGSIQNGLNSESLTDNSSDSVIDRNFQKVSELRQRIDSVGQTLNWVAYQMQTQDFAYVDELARNLLMQQFQSLQKNSIDLKQRAEWKLSSYTFRNEYINAKAQFEKSVSIYLISRDPKDLLAARANYATCQAVFGNYEQYNIEFPFEKVRGRNLLEDLLIKVGHFIWVGELNEPVEFALQELEAAIAKGPAKDSSSHGNLEDWRKEHIDKSIAWLHQQLGSDQVDFLVWKLAGQKSGENWGFVHRYDDLNILKEAILKASEILVEKIFTEEAAGLDRDCILMKCYENLGRPLLSYPTKWMGDNISHYPQTLKRVITDMKLQEGGYKEAISSDPSLLVDVSDLRLGEDVLKFWDVSKLLNKLEFLAQANQVIPDDIKRQVEDLINSLSRKDLKDTINYEVWHLSQAQDKSGENWGEVHRYDDPKVLRLALMVAYRNDFDSYLVNQLRNPADQNAFYAEIGRLHYTFFNLGSSNPNFVELGKENIALWLHMHSHVLRKVNMQIENRIRAQDSKLAKSLDVESLIKMIETSNDFVKSLREDLERIMESPAYRNMTTRYETFLARWCAGQLRFFCQFDQELLKDRIKKIVEERIDGRVFNDEIKQEIFLRTWRLAGEPKGNPRFGQENYLNDLGRLYYILSSIRKEIQ